MKLYCNEILRKYAEEYITLGMKMGYFDYNLAKELSFKLFSIDVEMDASLPGDAYSEKNKLKINPNRILKTDGEFTSLVLFHEFTHYCNDIHNDMFSPANNSLIQKLKNNASSYINTDYIHNFSTTKMNDINNPFTYMVFGALFIDEVVAENVATEMVKMKYNKFIPLKNYQKTYGNNTIDYQAHFGYYGIGENLVDDFAKTLFLKSNCKNLNGLCKETFKKDFVYDLIRQHYERPSSFACLIEELAHFGVLSFVEEQANGHYLDGGKVSPDLAYKSYFRLKELLSQGKENREFIPDNIPLPSFM